MSAPQKYTVTPSSEQSAYVDSLIATGAYRAAEDVIEAGLDVRRDNEVAASLHELYESHMAPK